MAAPPATPESVARRTASIQDAIARVSSSAEKYAEISEKNIGDPSKAAETATVQNGLALDIRKLLCEVQGPMGTMMELVGAVSGGRTPLLSQTLYQHLFTAGSDRCSQIVARDGRLQRAAGGWYTNDR